jgi:hypothetical protein
VKLVCLACERRAVRIVAPKPEGCVLGPVGRACGEPATVCTDHHLAAVKKTTREHQKPFIAFARTILRTVAEDDEFSKGRRQTAESILYIAARERGERP